MSTTNVARPAGTAVIEWLRDAFAGPSIGPADAGDDEARAVLVAVDRRPAAIAIPRDAPEDLIRLARTSDASDECPPVRADAASGRPEPTRARSPTATTVAWSATAACAAHAERRAGAPSPLRTG